MNRRRILIAASSVAATGTGAWAVARTVFSRDESLASTIDRLLDSIGNRRAFREVGEHILGCVQTASTLDESIARLSRVRVDATSCLLSRNSRQQATLAALRLSCQQDFQSGRVRAIAGWILSETELDLCVCAAAREQI
jgi:hypothetical protein